MVSGARLPLTPDSPDGSPDGTIHSIPITKLSRFSRRSTTIFKINRIRTKIHNTTLQLIMRRTCTNLSRFVNDRLSIQRPMNRLLGTLPTTDGRLTSKKIIKRQNRRLRTKTTITGNRRHLTRTLLFINLLIRRFRTRNIPMRNSNLIRVSRDRSGVISHDRGSRNIVITSNIIPPVRRIYCNQGYSYHEDSRPRKSPTQFTRKLLNH